MPLAFLSTWAHCWSWYWWQCYWCKGIKSENIINKINRSNYRILVHVLNSFILTFTHSASCISTPLMHPLVSKDTFCASKLFLSESVMPTMCTSFNFGLVFLLFPCCLSPSPCFISLWHEGIAAERRKFWAWEPLFLLCPSGSGTTWLSMTNSCIYWVVGMLGGQTFLLCPLDKSVLFPCLFQTFPVAFC